MGNDSLGHSMPLAQFTVISIRPSGENCQTTLLIEVDTEIRYLESLGSVVIYMDVIIYIFSLPTTEADGHRASQPAEGTA